MLAGAVSLVCGSSGGGLFLCRANPPRRAISLRCAFVSLAARFFPPAAPMRTAISCFFRFDSFFVRRLGMGRFAIACLVYGTARMFSSLLIHNDF